MATQTGSIDLKGLKEAAAPAINSEQYFWHNSVDSGAGEGAGAHITQVPQDTFISDPTNGGGNLFADASGIAVRDGLAVLASFGSSGAIIGENASGKGRTEILSGGMQVIRNVNGTDQVLANIGYGLGNDDQGGTANAPYYSFGNRSGAIGNYSIVLGSGQATAQQAIAHANGQANGVESFASGKETVAASPAQYVIGSWNIIDNNSDFVVIIGNGSNGTRSNALEITRAGQIRLPNNVSLRGYNTARTNSYQIGYISTNDRTALGNTLLPTVLQGSNGNSSGVIIDYLGRHAQLYKVVDIEITCGVINAHSYQAAQDIDISSKIPTNYRAVGVVGYTSANFRIRTTTCYIKSEAGTLNVGFANASASNVTTTTETHIKVLCLKATSA